MAINTNALQSALGSLGDTGGVNAAANLGAAGDRNGLNNLVDSKIAQLEKSVSALEDFVTGFSKYDNYLDESWKDKPKDSQSQDSQSQDQSQQQDDRSEAEKSASAQKAADTRKANGNDQWRAPKGSPNAGQFIDMPQAALAKVGMAAQGEEIKSLLTAGKVAEAQQKAEQHLNKMDAALNSLYSMSFSAKVEAMTASGGNVTTKKIKWEGPLGFEGQFTGDNRYIMPLALDWSNVTFPQPFRWASEDIGAHDGARVIGTIEGINRLEDGTIWGWGTFDMDSELGIDAQRHVEKKLSNGVSLDLDRISAEVSDPASLRSEIGNLADAVQDMNITTIRGARTRSATLVALPAFEGARIEAVEKWKQELKKSEPVQNKKLATKLRVHKMAVKRRFKKKVALRQKGINLALKMDANGAFVGIDAGGQWHATIPTKGNRWIDMPGSALAGLFDMVHNAHSQGNDSRAPGGKVDEDEATVEKSLASIQESNVKVHDLLEKGDEDSVRQAQDEVQKVLDNFPFEDYEGEDSVWAEDENGDEVEVDAAAEHREALQAFVDVDPKDFIEQAMADQAEEDGADLDPVIEGANGDADHEDDGHEPDGSEDAGASEGDDSWFNQDGIDSMYDPEDWDADTQAAAKARVDEMKAGAPEGWTFSEPDEDNPFGSWENEDGDHVMLAVATSDFLEGDESGLEAWVHSGEGDEAQVPANWNDVQEAIDYGGDGEEGDADGDGLTGDEEDGVTAEEAGSKGASPAEIRKEIAAAIKSKNTWQGGDTDAASARTKANAAAQDARIEELTKQLPAGEPKTLAELKKKVAAEKAPSEESIREVIEFLNSGYQSNDDYKLLKQLQGKLAEARGFDPQKSVDKGGGRKETDLGNGWKLIEDDPKGTWGGYRSFRGPEKGEYFDQSGTTEYLDRDQMLQAIGANILEKERLAARQAEILGGDSYSLGKGEMDRRDRASLVASGTKLAAPVAPPKDWFEDPKFKMATPLTVTKEGRVFGHLALWGTCHAAFGGEAGNCVSVPSSETDYSLFHLGVVETAEGTEVPVGRLAMETGHADDHFSSRRAIAHYENTGLAIADIRAGEDQFGIWFSGALRPDATPSQVRALKASPLSGDWRHHPGTNNLELVMALAVNMPGFAVPRPQFMVASGAVRSLVAAGIVAPRRVTREKVERAKAGDQLAIDDIKYLQKLAARERAQEAKLLKQRALVASGAPNKIHALAAQLKGAAKPVEGKK